MSTQAAGTQSVFKWNAINQVGTILLRLAVSITLQRILLPADFGIVANIMVFAEVSQIFVDSGFQGAIVQAKEVNQRGLSSAFILNLFIGAFFTTLLFCLAPSIGKYYHNADLVPVARFLSLIYLLQSAALVQRALLVRNHAFKDIAVMDITSTGITGAAAVLLAFFVAGPWAIAAMYVGQVFFNNVQFWLRARWKPNLIMDRTEIKKFWKYGSNVFGNALFTYATTRVDLFLIGKYLPLTAQGYYSSGKRYGVLPTNVFVSIVTKSYFPIFSRMQDQTAALNATYFVALRYVGALSGLAFPLFFLMSPGSVLLVIGEKWMPMVPVLQSYIVFSSIHVFNSLNANFLAALGKPRLTFINSVISGSVRLCVIIAYFASVDNPSLVAIAGIIAFFSFVENHISAYFIRKLRGYAIINQYVSAYRDLLAGWAIAVLLYTGAASIWPQGAENAIPLVLLTVLYPLAYIGILFATKSPLAAKIRNVVQKKRGKALV